MSEPDIKRIDTKVVYKNRWMTVREDRVRRPNGDHGLFGVVDKPDFSLIIPYDGERFYLAEQFRYPVNGRFREFPQGALEFGMDTTPEQIAANELQQETGLVAQKLQKLGKLFQAYGYASQGVHIFLATGLTAADQSSGGEDKHSALQSFTRSECDAMILDGSIADLATVAALQLFDNHVKGEAGD